MGQVALAATVLAVYANSLGGSFHYDDFHSIVDNPHIRSLANVGSFFTDTSAFSGDPAKGMYRPLLVLSYALNYQVGGGDATGYLLVNVLLHATAALVLWSLAQAVGLSRGQAFLAALLFAVHPLGAEPVNYISSRSELLAACFYLLAFRLYLAPGKRPHALSLTCFALGLLCKSVVITLPAVLWLYTWLAGGSARPRRLLPYGLVAVAYSAILVATGFAGASARVSPRPLDIQVLTQLKAVPYYLGLVSMPVNLNVEHQFSASIGPGLAVVASAALLASGLWLAARSRHRVTGFWILWPVLLSLPAALVPLNVLVNERRLYLPVAGLCILLVRLLAVRLRPDVGRVAAMVSVAALAGLTVQRNTVWADEYSLWNDAVRKSPHMPRAHVHLGNALRDRGEKTRAAQAYTRAVELDGSHRAARTNLANLLYEEAAGGRHGEGSATQRQLLERAATQYLAVLETDPAHREALANLGNVYLAMGHPSEAEDLYRRAIEAEANFADGHYNLGRLYLEEGRLGEAARALERATELQPHRADGFFLLGNATALQGQMDRAASAFQRACDLAPGEPAYCYNLGEVLLNLAADESGHETGGAQSLRIRARAAYGRVAAADPNYRMVRERLVLLARTADGGRP